MPLFSKQAANSLVTETSQYFVFFCRSVCSANLAKCLIINVLRLIIVILFFIAFLNITYSARHTFATEICLTQGVPIESVSKMLGHTNIQTTQIYARVVDRKLSHDMAVLEQKLQSKGKRPIAIVNP
nr:tyrosine-type recombinase/integrase [uncultured Phocaeicola sp.]